ncbi:hypothetical protein ACFWYA_05915 [Streptomyces sp. NPDC059011]|uniref:hypothetical protein n=1 Tax=unclassified Streptomyces TaxID=2593676 RepID=UPI00367F4BDB
MSTKGQLLDRQIHALNTAGCIRIFSDKRSGKNAERDDGGTGTSRPRPARPPGEHRHLDRKAPRRLQEHDLQLRARAEGRSPRTR